MPRYIRSAHLRNVQDYGAQEDDEDINFNTSAESPTAPEGPAPIDREIARLEHLVPDHKKLFVKTYPRTSEVSVALPDLDLSILQPSFRDVERGFHLTDEEQLLWLRSGQVLMSLKLFHQECLSDAACLAELELVTAQMSMRDIACRIAELSEMRPIPATVGEGPAQTKALPICARFAHQIVHVNKFDFFSRLEKKENFKERRRSMVGARALLTAYADLQQNPEGFFAILLDSNLALPMKKDARKAWERLWILPFEITSDPVVEAEVEDDTALAEADSVIASDILVASTKMTPARRLPMP